MTQADLEKNICSDYLDGLSMKNIQDKYSIGYKKVRNTLDRNNIARRPKKGTPNKKNIVVLTDYEEQKIIDLARDGLTATEIGYITHHGQDVIRRYLQKNGLYQTHKESVLSNPQNQRKYPVVDDFFDTENPIMAYIMGFIAADGTVRKDSNEVKIGLSSVDRDFLVILKSYIGGCDVKDYTTQKGFDVSEWHFTSAHIKQKLAEYNIVPNKTFTFTFPKNLNKKYWIDFIRGYFDGDGTICRAGNGIRWSLCSVNKDILEVVANFFYEEYGIDKPYFGTRTGDKHNLYYIQYSTIPTKEIYKIFYPKGCLYLPRKKKKYEEII